jgi:hypothetical protein
MSTTHGTFGTGNCCWCPPCTQEPDTRMEGGRVVFENANYRISCGDDNTVNVYNKNTGEQYCIWGDPHVNVDGQHAFDFLGTTTFVLDDGTKVTIDTVPWQGNPEMTLASEVTITDGDYAVQISGIDGNCTGDLKFEEAEGWGRLADAVTPDGNTIYENPCGAGFLGFDGGRMQRVDQCYIDRTDLERGGALQQRYAQALQAFAGLVAIGFVGSFLAGLGAAALAACDGGCRNEAPFALLLTRSGSSWFAAGVLDA